MNPSTTTFALGTLSIQTGEPAPDLQTMQQLLPLEVRQLLTTIVPVAATDARQQHIESCLSLLGQATELINQGFRVYIFVLGHINELHLYRDLGYETMQLFITNNHSGRLNVPLAEIALSFYRIGLPYLERLKIGSDELVRATVFEPPQAERIVSGARALAQATRRAEAQKETVPEELLDQHTQFARTVIGAEDAALPRLRDFAEERSRFSGQAVPVTLHWTLTENAQGQLVVQLKATVPAQEALRWASVPPYVTLHGPDDQQSHWTEIANAIETQLAALF